MYVCREHSRPVNWKGRGCPRCDAEKSEAKRRKQNKDSDFVQS